MTEYIFGIKLISDINVNTNHCKLGLCLLELSHCIVFFSRMTNQRPVFFAFEVSDHDLGQFLDKLTGTVVDMTDVKTDGY